MIIKFRHTHTHTLSLSLQMKNSSALLPHVVVFPFPAQGHINPGLQFSQLLASCLSLCNVTFVNTSYNIAKLRAAHLDLGPRIRLRALADDGQHGNSPDFFACVEHMGGLLESLLLSLLQRNTHEDGCTSELIHGEEKEKNACGIGYAGLRQACGGDPAHTEDCSRASHEGVEEEKTKDECGNSFNDIQNAHGDDLTHVDDCKCDNSEDLNGDGDWLPPVCIVSDVFLGWVQDIADKLKIPRFILYTPSPATLVLMLSLPKMLLQGRLPCYNALDEAHTQPLNLPGLTRTLCLADVPSHLLLPPSAFMFNYFIRHSKRIPEATAVLLNSFYKLQSSAIDVAQDLGGPFPTMWANLLQKHLQYKVIPVGPLLPSCMFDGSRNMKAVAPRASGAEDKACLQWLESHPPSSVVYVSFGSMGELAEEQIHQLAWGLEASGKPFLWVVPGESARYLPQDMRLEVLADAVPPRAAHEVDTGVPRTSGLSWLGSGAHTLAAKRLVVSWAPQLDVLSHPSTGFFLSHCGWNSTLEAICAGVPVLGWPLFAEQKMNCRFLVDELKVGMEFIKGEGGMVGKEEVERVVREVLETEQGHLMRRCASEWKGLAREAVSDGGPSHENVKAFGSFLSSLHAWSKT